MMTVTEQKDSPPQNLFPLTLKSLLCKSQLWTSYQDISISMFPLPQLALIDVDLGLVFK